jgi:hypothetical protein
VSARARWASRSAAAIVFGVLLVALTLYAALRADASWLRARLGTMDARLRALEMRADLSAGSVLLPAGDTLATPPPAAR